MTSPTLSVEGLTVSYLRPDGGDNTVVWQASLALEPGKILGLAGESGCGKSTFALAAIGYRAAGALVKQGVSNLGAVDLLQLPTDKLRRIWGRRVVYVLQNASLALNPAITVGRQLGEPMAFHLGLRGEDLRKRQLELFEQVGIPEAPRALDRYPHEFSGGQQQRIAIAIALSCRPEVVVLDEPTTGLDVTTQARITGLLRALLHETGAATLYVSHDLSLLSTIADHLAVMYAGEIVEEGDAGEVIRRPRHPYTQALIASVPSAHERKGVAGIPGRPPSRAIVDSCSFSRRCPYVVPECRSRQPGLGEAETSHFVRCLLWRSLEARPVPTVPLPLPTPGSTMLLEVSDVACSYPNASGPAVRNVSFSIAPSETIGIVGESGSGKSTLLRAIAGLHVPDSGSIVYRGAMLPARAPHRVRSVLGEIQLVFQNPESSLNPSHTVEDLLRRPLRLFRPDVPRSRSDEAIQELLEKVKLPSDMLHRYPVELSGGQKQRVALARAFAAKPALLLCDEVTSALDVSVQASILELLAELATQSDTAVIFVSHDLAVVRTIAERTLVMKDGQVCEEGETEQLFAAPAHPYTYELICAIPELRGSTSPYCEPIKPSSASLDRPTAPSPG